MMSPSENPPLNQLPPIGTEDKISAKCKLCDEMATHIILYGANGVRTTCMECQGSNAIPYWALGDARR